MIDFSETFDQRRLRGTSKGGASGTFVMGAT